MAHQKFSAAEREAIWLAHEKKCAYTRELIDVSSFHIEINDRPKDNRSMERMRDDITGGYPDRFEESNES
jgi:hypothetical protein